MQSFLNLGRTIIIHNSEPKLYYCSPIAGIRKLLDAVPLSQEALEMVASTGKILSFVGTNRLLLFGERINSTLNIKRILSNQPVYHFFFINKSDFVVGSYLKYDDGYLIFLPSVGSRPELNLKPDFDKDFIDSIVVLVKELQKKADDIELPIWGGHYLLPDEHDRRKNILILKEELIKVHQKILEEQEIIAELERNKLLFVVQVKLSKFRLKKSLKN